MKKYLQHLSTCNVTKDWSEAEQALADTPHMFRDIEYQQAVEELNNKKKECTCGLETAITSYEDMSINYFEGRKYLMAVDPDEITVEGALEAFGFGANGLG